MVACASTDGHNLVLHEFAHKLDMLDGAVDGTPPMAAPARAHWSEVMARAYDQHAAEVARGRQWLARCLWRDRPG